MEGLCPDKLCGPLQTHFHEKGREEKRDIPYNRKDNCHVVPRKRFRRQPLRLPLPAGLPPHPWPLPDRRKSYYDEDYLPRKLDRVDEAGNLYFDGSPFPWKLADDFDEDKRWGYSKWKVMLGKLTGKGKK